MTSRAAIIDAIETLRKARCNFILEYPGACGCAHAHITGEDIASAILDGVNLAARVSGLTPDEYAEWVELSGRVRCTARTARGKQCRHTVSGPMISNPFEWKTLRDSAPYCPTHCGD
ncbi:hypothetical protein [Burkholderia sp. Ax-1724]|uniref:hypothetical protein n=1 Tax=Burkholderia sp. Ax-1724 TaxID=2608336 RepID=UPI0014225FFD|nr:hypothetical protein [Burkholderia sp. Ax-1724]NIF56267.1 hypothetical protein [Burkholderia sp. Ax-1724]